MADEESSIDRRREKARERGRRWLRNHPEYRVERRKAVQRYRVRHWMKVAFWVHRGGAKKRGIEFLLNFEEWSHIWLESGKWDQRGYKNGQYVMARFNDRGPYVVGNVTIVLAEANRAEANQRKPFLGKTWAVRNGKRVWMSRDRSPTS